MHAIKGGWVGQTFALANCNDSGGRKSRIRRSKEERKAMVESFIKKYQKSNNGNFPSLNLTHKEVGGSFYTVREIVREIIQENRVLGPAKLAPEEQSSDRFAEQYPLGSISIEPEVHLSLSADGTPSVPNHLGTSEELVLNSSGQHTGLEHQRFGNEQVINGSQADEIDKEFDELINLELQVSETLEADKNVEEDLEASTAKVSHLTANTLEADKNVVEELEASTAKVSHLTANVVVETFPLSSVAKPNYSFNGSSSEASDLTGTLGEKEIKNLELEPGNQSALENSSGLVDEKAIANPAGPLLERNSGLGDEKALVNLGDPSLESSNCSTTKGAIVHGDQDGINLEVEVSRNNVLTSETFEQGQTISLDGHPSTWIHNGAIQPTIAPNGMHAKDFNGTNTSSSGPLDPPEAMMVENKVDVQGSSSSQKGSNPTLDRINLESWEGASKKPEESETNPFLTFLKAFVAAFVKFWSE